MKKNEKFSKLKQRIYAQFGVTPHYVIGRRAREAKTLAERNASKEMHFSHKGANIEFYDWGNEYKDEERFAGSFEIPYLSNGAFQQIMDQLLKDFLAQANKRFPNWQMELREPWVTAYTEGNSLSWEECIELTQMWDDFHTKAENTLLETLKQLQSN